MSSSSSGKSRNIWVWLLVAGALILGILNLIDAVRFLGQSLFGLLRLEFFNIAWLGALLSFVVAAIWLSVARQLYSLDSRGWVFVMAIATINLVFLGMSLLGGNSFGDIAPNLVINVLALIIGLLPGTKAAFGK